MAVVYHPRHSDCAGASTRKVGKMRTRPFLSACALASGLIACQSAPGPSFAPGTGSRLEPIEAGPSGGPAHPSMAIPVRAMGTLDPRASLAEPGVLHATQADGAGDEWDEEEALALQLANPLATLISVPIQTNWDRGIGPADAKRTTINIQPVVPFTLNEDWKLITRTIVPVIDAESPVSGGSDESGLGDITESLFFSPSKPTASGWIWGAGPVLLLPTASNDALGAEKWAVGPTAVALRQRNGWTTGALVNHLWSFAGEDNGKDINASFFQPFLSYTTQTATTLGLNTETSYDWDGDQWTVPLNVTAGQLLLLGKLPLSVTVGYRNYLEAPSGGPDWGMRLVVTPLFPKK